MSKRRHNTAPSVVIDQPTAAPARPGSHLWLGLLLLTVTVIAYLPSIRGGLLWDDEFHITSPQLQSLNGLWRIWFDPGATQQYYPLLHSAFWLEHHLWGDSTAGYHLLNVTLHAIAAFLFALVLYHLSIRGAWIAALIFALHPVCVESVAWISEQKNTLSTVFYLAAMLLYLQHDEEANKRAVQFTGRYFLALGVFIAAILSKSVTVTLPAALLVVTWWRRGKLSWRRDVRPLVPWFALSITGGLFTAWVERRLVGAVGPDFGLSALERSLIAGRAIWFYLGKLLWPANLIFIYPRWDVRAPLWWQYLYPAGAVGLIVAAWMVRRRTRAPLAALLFFVGSLFPALGFFNVYPFLYSFVADHFQYLASFGIIAFIAAGFAGSAAKWRTPVAVGVIAVLGTLTWLQCRMYVNAKTLYQTTLARNPACWMAYNNLGLISFAEGRLSEAAVLYQQALKIKPDYAEAHNNLGTVLNSDGHTSEAISHFNEALRVKPNYPAALNNLGNALLSTSVPAAIAHLEKALQLKPDYPEARLNLGVALFKTNRIPEAGNSLKEALRLRPDYAEAHDALGVLLYSSRDLPGARTQFEEAVRLKPGYSPARRNLAEALWEVGQSDEAISQLETVVRLTPQDVEAAESLAKAYYAKGRLREAAAHYNNLGIVLQSLKRPDQALAHLREAIRISPDYADAHYNLGLFLISLDRGADAIGEFKAAVRYKPAHAEAHDALGAALYQSGRFAEAVAEFMEAVRLNPNLEAATKNLEIARQAAGKLR